MGHRTERNRIGLLAKGLSGALVASGLTFIMLPEAASGPRAPSSPQSTTTPTGRSVGRRDEAGGQLSKDVWVRSHRLEVPVGRLIIPAIDLDVPFRLGVHNRVVARGPGLWPGTPLPGERGNAVFAGHRTTHTHPFEDLNLLRRGNAIITKLRGRPRTVFRVRRIAVVPESEYKDFVLRRPPRGVRRITLFACTPKGFRSHRIVVRAKVRRPGQFANTRIVGTPTSRPSGKRGKYE